MKRAARANILIVEDEPAVQFLLAFIMKEQGYRVSQVNDTVSALSRLNWLKPLPDLILLDWMLPGINGLEFARRLRANEHTGHIPIVMLTARTDAQDKALGIEAGVADYITKPFSPRELAARVRAVLDSRMPHGSTAPAKGLPAARAGSASKVTPDTGPDCPDVIWL